MLHQAALAELGTFHERQGDQSYLTGEGAVTGIWGRYHHTRLKQTGDQVVEGTSFQLAPQFDGSLWLIQSGIDVYADIDDNGSQIRASLFYSHAESSGDVSGNILARTGRHAGEAKTNSDGIGATVTYVGESGWYLDFVGLYSWIDAKAQSFRGVSADFDGTSLAASLEGGYPFALAENWTLEPQAQLVWQKLKLDPSRDRYSRVQFDTFHTLSGRVGLRLEGTVPHESAILQPFLAANLWHNFSQKNEITFNNRSLISDGEASVLKLGGGLGALITPNFSLHFRLDWGTNLGEEHYRSRDANIGLRFTW